MEVSSDTCFPSLDRCDSRVTFSVEEAAILSQHARLPDQQKEITHLYDHLRSPLYAYLSTLGLVAAEAEEVIQEGFFRLVRDLYSGNQVSNIRAWLFRVVHNIAMDFYRRMDRDGSVDAESQWPLLKEQVDPDPDPEEAFRQQERRSRVNSAIQTLTSRQRNCLLLRAQGTSYHDIGMILGISTQRAAFLVRRGLARLADLCE